MHFLKSDPIVGVKLALLAVLAVASISGADAQTLGNPIHNSLNTPTIRDLKFFGAKCDGATDDSTAIQNWLNFAAPGITLTAPPGTCVFTRQLTTGAVNQYTIAGAGNYSTTFLYKGANTTNDLLVINSPAASQTLGVTMRDFGIVSDTAMTGGYAIHAYGLHAAVIDNVALDGVDGTIGTGDFCGGFLLTGASAVSMKNPIARSAQNCGDGIRVNGVSPGTFGGGAEVIVSGGDIGGQFVGGVLSGFINGLHMAGGFGGLRCDGTDIHNNQVGWLVDEADVATGNRELTQGSTCAIDTNLTAGVLINDSGMTGGSATLHGWIASTIQGPGVNIQAAGATTVLYDGNRLYNNCASGIYVQDAATYLLISSAASVYSNGANNSTSCGTWQVSHTGHGYGVEASLATTRIYSQALPIGNAAGAFNALSGLAGPPIITNAGSYSSFTVTDINGNPVYVILNTTAAGEPASLLYESNGTHEWLTGNDLSNRYVIQDEPNSFTDWLQITPGGNATIGESASDALSFLGTISFDNTVTLSAATGNALAIINANTAGNVAALAFQSSASNKRQIGSDSANALDIWDEANSATFWLHVTSGGSATIGEANTSVLTVKGAILPTELTVSTLPTCNSGAKGEIYEVTDALSPAWNATLTGGGTTLSLAVCNGSAWTAH